MAEITDIRAAGRGSHRRRVYLDGEEWRSVPQEVVRALGLRPGQAHDPAALDERIADTAPGQAWERALRLLNFKERGSGELRQRLTDDGYAMPIVEEVVRKAVELGFVDDRRFAEGLARRAVAKGRGRRRAAADLAAKGVDEALAAGILDACCDRSSERERALALARAAAARLAADPAKLAAMLCRAGFETALARRVAREVADAWDEPSEEG